MERSKKIIIASHCILNQNTVIPEEARSKGLMKSAVEWCDQESYGIVQLPCPEFTYLGLNRPSMTREEYDIQKYREHCQTILAPIMDQLRMYVESGYDLVGGFGIQSSPSCDPGRGIFMEEFLLLTKREGISIRYFWQIPATDNGYFDEKDPASHYGAIS
ncbi:hypothetical protein BEP19_02385 [Ammoniphilus oxalaticus]|uniref:DUF523 domain-containing protein n=1 Tax=Ammoniphilus oxalaticus TaxID=66863 RepID=A0A419SNE2_9BACL|nr:CD3072 family TudS-related putative desulfidase [Ammoniphilus oxalaticus]RKD25806.1 hypothetical protein BEP19_02385 [Ammoniphilus oxalaticus]